ncbi:MAG: hypothetical protein DMF76_07495, partial [Acidobacteria bacterium]
EGANVIAIDEAGDLVLHIRDGEELRLRKPVAYQDREDGRREIDVSYIALDANAEFRNLPREIVGSLSHGVNPQSEVHNRFGFRLGDYDQSKPLVIDPVILYSTYLGGSGEDLGSTIAVDSTGAAYIIGLTDSLNFPTVNPKQAAYGGSPQDVYIAKLNSAGNALVYSTYLGGNGQDEGSAIAIDANGNAYITGYSGSTNFPTVNALQGTITGAFNAFVAKLNPSGSQLIYSTYLGGSVGEYGSSIAVNSIGEVFVGGVTSSPNFPTKNPLQASFGGNLADAFVMKLNAAGNTLVYSTYIGGSGNDGITGIAVNNAGEAFVTGVTFSPNFPTKNAIQTNFAGGDFDAFLAKLSDAGSSLQFSTYLGGSGDDRGYRLALDSSSNVYVVGQTTSSNFPVASPLQATMGGGADAFMTKFSATGSLAFSTYLGGSGIDGATGVAVDASGNSYIIGFTDSDNFPVAAALQPVKNADDDGFIAKLNSAGSALSYSTYLGGSGRDSGFSIAVDQTGSAYVLGQTNSNDFPGVNFPFNTKGGGAADAFITKLADSSLASSSVQLSSATFATTEGCAEATVAVTRIGSTSGTVNVDYIVNDNTATQRTDFTFTSGSLRFDPGDTNKSISILITEDGYAEGAEKANVNIIGVSAGAALGTPRTATLNIIDNDAANSTTNPIDNAALFGCTHYHDFLNRQADQSGLAFWTNEIISCGTNQTCLELKRINVSAAYFLSTEFQQTGYLVERLYKTAYGDASGASTLGGAHQIIVPLVRFAEFLPDSQQLGQGVVVGQTGWEAVLENNKQSFAYGFVQRSRFTTAFPASMTPAQFVDTLFANAGLTPSATDRNATIGEFGSATNTADVAARARAVRRVAENPTLVTNEFNRAFVLMQFFGYLRRNPNDLPDSDYTGYDFWLTKLNQFNGNYNAAEMVKAFITSTEYRQRFGP